MAKKILINIASGLVILLVLALAVVLVLSTRGYFSDVITWLLLGLIGILALFTGYMTISRTVEAVQHRDADVEELSEHSIEKMLKTGEIPSVKNAISPVSSKLQAKEKERRERKTAAEEAKQLRRREALDKKQAAEEASRQRTEGLKGAGAAPTAATPEPTPMPVAPTFPAVSPAPAQPPRNFNEVRPPAKAGSRQEADADHQQAVESVRHQAEAAAAARRRAAAMAARSQSFPALKTGRIPAFNTGILEETAGVTDTRAHIFQKDPPVAQRGDVYNSGSIWEQMNVRQSAAPVLGGQVAPTPVHPVQQVAPAPYAPQSTASAVQGPAEDTLPPEHTPYSPAAHAVPPWQRPESGEEAPGEEVKADWHYIPAKPPKAWNTGGRIPGDMSTFAVPNTVPPQPVKDTATRAEAARAKAAVAEAHAETAKAKAAATKAKVAFKTEAGSGDEQKAGRPQTAPAASSPRPRGRPPKPKDEEELNQPKRPRGRPPKPKTEEELNQPKRPRGRPPKPKTEEELNQPKRPRGRPRKNPLPGEDTPEA